jgi:hypothetical protein
VTRPLLVTANGCRSTQPSSLIVIRSWSSVASLVRWAPFTFSSPLRPAERVRTLRSSVIYSVRERVVRGMQQPSNIGACWHSSYIREQSLNIREQLITLRPYGRLNAGAGTPC